MVADTSDSASWGKCTSINVLLDGIGILTPN